MVPPPAAAAAANADGLAARRIPSQSSPASGGVTRSGPGPLGMDRNMNPSASTNWGKQGTAMAASTAASSPVRTRPVNFHDRSSPIRGGDRNRSNFQDERQHRFDSSPRQQHHQAQAQAQAQPNYDSMMHQTHHHHHRPRVQFTSLSERNMALNKSSSNSTVGSTGSDARYTTSKSRPPSSPSTSSRRTHHFYLSNTATAASTASPGGVHQIHHRRQLQRMNSGESVSSDTGSGSVKSAPGWHGQDDNIYNTKNNKDTTTKKNNSSHSISGGGTKKSSSNTNVKTPSTRGMTTTSMQPATAITAQKNKKTTPNDVVVVAAAAQTELPTKQQTKQTKKVIDGTFNYRNPSHLKCHGTGKTSTSASIHVQKQSRHTTLFVCLGFVFVV